MVVFIKKIYYWLHQKTLRILSNIFSKRLPIESFNNILIFSPHPDDEVFGCAYLINYLSKQKKSINIIFLSKGEKGCKYIDERKVIEYRQQMAISSNNILGLNRENIIFLDFPDGAFDTIIDESYYEEQIENILKKIRPQFVFIPHPYENSPDHVAATGILNKILVEKSIEKYYYCVWVWHHMRTNKIFSLDFKKSYFIKGNKKIKQESINEYLKIKTAENIPVSGDFPIMFLDMFKWEKELYFKG